MIAAFRELLAATHCIGVRLCVITCERRVLKAKSDLADALSALDRCESNARIAAHVEQQQVPRSLRRVTPTEVAERC